MTPLRRAVDAYLSAALWYDGHALAGRFDPFNPPDWHQAAADLAAAQVQAVYAATRDSLPWQLHAEQYGAKLWQDQRTLTPTLTAAGEFDLTPRTQAGAA